MENIENNEIDDFCKFVPKIELHAHLNGSLSEKTVLNLLKEKQKSSNKNFDDVVDVIESTDIKKPLFDNFALFRILHRLVDDEASLKTITRDVIEEFTDDNVVYLELRTTPKSISAQVSKEDYIRTVLEVMIEKETRLRTKLILSLDRARGMDDALDTVRLAKIFKKNPKYASYLVGIDISGDPREGHLASYHPLLEDAKQAGLKLALHLGEVEGGDLEEEKGVLKAGLVDRIGHGVYMTPGRGGTTEVYDLVRKASIPLEVCITSNVKCSMVASDEDSHLLHWYKAGHPLVICTDDKGMFNTSSSRELTIARRILQLTKEETAKICLDCIQMTFLSNDERKQLETFMKKKINLLVNV